MVLLLKFGLRGQRWGFTLPNVIPVESGVKESLLIGTAFVFRGPMSGVSCAFPSRDGENTALSNPVDNIMENGMCAYKHPDEYLPNGLHHQHPKVSQVCRIHKYPGQSRYGVVGMLDTSVLTVGQDFDTEVEVEFKGAAKKYGALGFGTYDEELMTNQWLTTNNSSKQAVNWPTPEDCR